MTMWEYLDRHNDTIVFVILVALLVWFYKN